MFEQKELKAKQNWEVAIDKEALHLFLGVLYNTVVKVPRQFLDDVDIITVRIISLIMRNFPYPQIVIAKKI